MNFRVLEGPRENFIRLTMNGGRYDIFASGTIHPNSGELLEKFVRERKIEHARVHLDSAGGSLLGGINLGRAIRRLGFETDVKSERYEYGKGPIAACASACAYAYAGGTARFYSDDVGRIGLHQFYGNDDSSIDASDAQTVSGMIVGYLNEMGIDGRIFVVAAITHKESMTWLSTADAERLGLANNGVEPTSAHIKLSDGRPYLRLEQMYNDVTSRVLIICYDGELSVMGGIITTPERSQEQVSYFSVSLLEFDQTEYQAVNGPNGFKVEGSAIWIERPLDIKGRRLLLSSGSLGMWLHNNGAMRWGSYMNLTQVRPQIRNFVENCKKI